MIALIQKEKFQTAPWCIVCTQQCGPPAAYVCRMCEGYIITYYGCPKCGDVGEFSGHDAPSMCECGYCWPDLISLKVDELARVKYHTGKRT